MWHIGLTLEIWSKCVFSYYFSLTVCSLDKQGQTKFHKSIELTTLNLCKDEVCIEYTSYFSILNRSQKELDIVVGTHSSSRTHTIHKHLKLDI